MKPSKIKFACRECRAKFRAVIEEAGTTCECPKCGKPLSVPFPGIGRWGFLMCFVVWAVVATFAKDIPWFWLIANLVILLPACASRLENIGSKRVWCWLCMVPGVGLLVAVYCLIAPSGYSKSKKMDLPAKIVTGNVAALLLISIGLMLWEKYKPSTEDQLQINTLMTRVQLAETEVAKAKTRAVQAESAALRAGIAQEEQEKMTLRLKAIEQELVEVGIPADKSSGILKPTLPTSSSEQMIDDAATKIAKEQVARVTAETVKAKYAEKYDAAIDRMEAKFPDCFDEKTDFFKAFSPRFDDAIKSKDAVTKDPEWVFHLAETVAHQLAAKGVPVIIKELPEGEAAIRIAAQKNQLEFEQNEARKMSKEEVVPSVTKFEETLQRLAKEKHESEEVHQQAPAINQPQTVGEPQTEMQQYLDAARRGEAGVNPRDQTAARSGDPYAAARIRHQMAGNNITRRLNEGLITAEVASIERASASAAYQRELAAIEQQKILDEMRRQNEELERMNRELERRRYQRR